MDTIAAIMDAILKGIYCTFLVALAMAGSVILEHVVRMIWQIP